MGILIVQVKYVVNAISSNLTSHEGRLSFESKHLFLQIVIVIKMAVWTVNAMKLLAVAIAPMGTLEKNALNAWMDTLVILNVEVKK